MEDTLRKKVSQLRARALMIGLIGTGLAILGFFVAPKAIPSSYLVAYLFWLGVSLGALPLIMLHHLTGGGWGYAGRRLWELMARLLPWLALAFLPIVFQMQEIYSWARPEIMAHDELVQKKSLYLNTGFFLGRAVLYFLIWSLLAFAFYRGSRAYDRTGERSIRNRLQGLGGFGLVLYGLTVTFSSVDWAMSLEPHWFSTIYGVLFMVGQTVAAFALVIVLLAFVARNHPGSTLLNPSRSHDLGNLLFAFLMIWAYISLSQFLIIWSGNISEETPWYLKRFQGGWQILSFMLTLFHFVVPFFLLLGRPIKRNIQSLAAVALLILLMRWIDLVWLIKPVFYQHLTLNWIDAACFAGLGGLWLALLLNAMLKVPLQMEHDPLLHQTPEGAAP